MMKLRVLNFFFPLLITACNQSQATKAGAGWHLMREHGGYAGSLSFEFGDPAKTVFVVKCNGSPWFMLLGGDYPEGAEQFTLMTDDTLWKLPAERGPGGRGLFVEQAGAATAVAQAKRRIQFSVGSWMREVTPGPQLKQFINSCAS